MSKQETDKVDFDPGEVKAFDERQADVSIIELPVKSLDSVATEFHCPSMDPELAIAVDSYISEDGGATWIYNGGFTREPGPWIGKDGLPTEVCGSHQSRSIGDGSIRKMPDGTLMRSEVRVSKPVDGKVVRRVDVEAAAKSKKKTKAKKK